MVVALFAASIADTLREKPKIQTGFDLFTAVLFVTLGAGILPVACVRGGTFCIYYAEPVAGFFFEKFFSKFRISLFFLKPARFTSRSVRVLLSPSPPIPGVPLRKCPVCEWYLNLDCISILLSLLSD